MKRNLIVLFVAILLSLKTLQGVCADQDLKQSLTPSSTDISGAFQSGVKYFEANDYPQAISEFEKILETGAVSGPLFYNLGNAYFKNGELGKSLWAFEWARYFMPRDPDVRFNWEFAQKRTTDKIEPNTAWVLKHALSLWVNILNTQEWLMVFLGSAALMWVSFTLLLFRRKLLWRNTAAAFALVAVTAVFASYDRSFAMKHQAFLVEPEITVRAGPSDNSTELFKLHEGTKVTVKGEDSAYARISLIDGKTGWVDKHGLRAGMVTESR